MSRYLPETDGIGATSEFSLQDTSSHFYRFWHFIKSSKACFIIYVFGNTNKISTYSQAKIFLLKLLLINKINNPPTSVSISSALSKFIFTTPSSLVMPSISISQTSFNVNSLFRLISKLIITLNVSGNSKQL